jgi:DNA-binding transcriptional ArsR family regulator
LALQHVFRALSDSTRREILRLLRQEDLTAGEIAANFTITKASVSHHLSILKHAGLVSDVRRGRNIVYSLDATVFQEALGWLIELSRRGER